MTYLEFRKMMNEKFGINPWPKTYEVDHETYANVCQHIFKWRYETTDIAIFEQMIGPHFCFIEISIGADNQGIMFKSVELILKGK